VPASPGTARGRRGSRPGDCGRSRPSHDHRTRRRSRPGVFSPAVPDRGRCWRSGRPSGRARHWRRSPAPRSLRHERPRRRTRTAAAGRPAAALRLALLGVLCVLCGSFLLLPLRQRRTTENTEDTETRHQKPSSKQRPGDAAPQVAVHAPDRRAFRDADS
jgi:hypothetical protein